jgi:hypothetical protein
MQTRVLSEIESASVEPLLCRQNRMASRHRRWRPHLPSYSKSDFEGTYKGGYLESGARLIVEAVAVSRHVEHGFYSVSVEP